MKSLDDYKNGAQSILLSGISDTDTILYVKSGDGTKFPSPSFNCIIWNQTDYPNPTTDPAYEIVQVTSISGDGFSIARAQESTTAVTHNTYGKTYGFAAAVTAKLLTVDIPIALNNIKAFNWFLNI